VHAALRALKSDAGVLLAHIRQKQNRFGFLIQVAGVGTRAGPELQGFFVAPGRLPSRSYRSPFQR